MFYRGISTTSKFFPKRINNKQLKNLTTPELLSECGFISQPNAGLTNWLPLGKSVLDSISKIIHRRHKESGCIEVELSSLSNEKLWKKTGRWDNDELYKIDEFCLAATAEEEMTQLVHSKIKSYKQMPIIMYQLTRKYRKEKRARGGLLRGREFVMKDAYSYDYNKEAALNSFEKMNKIYSEIFNDLKLPWIKANADSGSIGGDLSYEWHIVSEVGEDTLVECDQCGSCGNIEKVKSIKMNEETKGKANNAGFSDEANVSYWLGKDSGELIAIYWPKGRRLSLKFVKEEELVEIDEKLQGDKAIEAYKQLYIERDGLVKMIRLVDIGVGPGTKMPDLPDDVGFSRNRMITFEGLDITEAQDKDQCEKCGGSLKEKKGVEVGHTFYLGTKYSESMDAKFMSNDNTQQFYEMGCYGIGVSRLVGVIAETMRDSNGLKWPAAIAPVQISLISTRENLEKPQVKELALALESNQLRTEVNDDGTDFGRAIHASKVCGVPLQVIIGNKFPQVEIEIRGEFFTQDWQQLQKSNGKEWGWEIQEKDKHLVHIDHCGEVLKELIKNM
ncbi:putative proline--tRNA ligase [Martiniozyma asiatica (nom. inval.)]|nr:putative proline--tRNA ligase [Martiniozyma asiatica]